MFVEIPLHSFIIPSQKLVDDLTERTANGDLFLFASKKIADEEKCLLCFGWSNYVKYENGLVTFGCRVLEDTDKQIGIKYKITNGVKEIESLYLV